MALIHLCLPRAPCCNRLHSLRQQLAPSNLQRHACFVPQVRCAVGDQPASKEPSRRSANYSPSLWEDKRIQSLSCNYMDDEMHGQRIEKLKEDVRRSLLHKEEELVNKLELVDVIQQLGLAYHFEKEIKDIVLGTIYTSMDEITILVENDLYATSLLFRLLRGNGFFVSQDLFKSFKDERGDFKASLHDDANGMLSLYEASNFAMAGELILEEAMEFTKKHLKDLLEGGLLMNPRIEEKIVYALEVPLNWRANRLHARWFIERYETHESMIPTLLEFAKLDFNMIQSIYQRELKDLSRWWADLDLVGGKLSFARDRLVECYFWSAGWCFEPKFQRCREAITKANNLITVIDDVYDIYGSLDELELFTDAVERWDVNAIDQLPEYMQICFLGLFNTCNDIAYAVLKEKGLQIIHCLKQTWADICKAYLVEARWYHSQHTPTLEEYLGNGWISISVHIALVLAYCHSEDVTEEALQRLGFYPDVVRQSAMIIRLWDDLATSKDELERGDVPKSIQCCMHEKGVSEAEARKHARDLIDVAWKELNRYQLMANSTTTDPDHDDPEAFRTVAMNIPRMTRFFYEHGDGFGMPDGKTKERVISLLMKPISL